jgi:hypothetical protein
LTKFFAANENKQLIEIATFTSLDREVFPPVDNSIIAATI